MNVPHESKLKSNTLHPMYSILSLLGLFFLGLLVGQLVAVACIEIIYHYSFDTLRHLTENPTDYAHSRTVILLNHAISTILFAFILATVVWRKLIERKTFSSLFQFENSNFWALIGLAAAVTLFSMPLNSVFISLNKNMILPEWMAGIEAYIRNMESSAENISRFLVDFQNPSELVLGLIVMGALTGIGEELIFRGALQSKLIEWLKNPHLAIWIAAAIFSFIHMQFYGFLPRMLLAALFGYMYYWSKNLWVPIIAHACNNSFTVLAFYFSKTLKVENELVDSSEIMPVPTVLISLIVTILILYQFRKITLPYSKEL